MMKFCSYRAGRNCGWLVLLLVLVTAAPTETYAASGDWSHDARSAMKQAQEEGKDILINVTGSDWCPGCIQMDRNVFSKPAFETRVADGFVLLEFDFPRGKQQSEAVRVQNKAWRDRLQAYEGYPTILLADAQGRPYARAGLVADPVAFTDQLSSLKEQKTDRDRAFAAAEQLQGLEKARRLDEVLQAMADAPGGQLWVSAYRSVVDEIILLDAEDEAGLRSKYEQARNEARAVRGLARVSDLVEAQQHDAALRAMDSILNGPLSAERRQSITASKAILLFNLGRQQAGYAAMGQAIAIQADPAQTQQLEAVREQMRAAMPVGTVPQD